MAVGQISDVAGFVEVLETYRAGSGLVAAVGAGVLIAGELLAGVGLLRPGSHSRIRTSWLAIGVTGAWSLLGAQAFARGLALENCGCFGVHLAQPLRWWILVEDIEFVALAWWVHRAVLRSTSTFDAGAPIAAVGGVGASG